MGAAKSTLIPIHIRSYSEKARMSLTLPQAGLTGPEKLKAVTTLMNMLTQDLVKVDMLPHQRDAALDELKVYGRDPRNADPMFTKEAIETLTKHALNSSSSTTSRNALRCLANTLLIRSETRQMFVDLGCEAKVCAKLKSGSLDDEFLVSRIIFLTTYGTNVQLRTLIDQHHLAEHIVQNLARHAKLLTAKTTVGGSSSGSSSKAKAATDPMADMALTETAKLLFNVTHFCPDRAEAFSAAIPSIVTMICRHDVAQPKPLDPPLGPLVNALLTLDLAGKEAKAALFHKSGPAALADRLTQLLDLALHTYGDAELDQTVLPLVTALRKIYELAPADKVRPSLHAQLLPTEADRKKVLGRGDNLPAQLLRHTTNALAPEFRNAVSHLLFELSDKDAAKFVQNVGYGFAAGFLFQNNVPVPDSVRAGESSSGSGDGARPVNAVTGQFLDAEAVPNIPEMTDAEKEREAERLFVLFERLKRTGIVDVENPVATALRQGRLQKIDDDKRVEELD